MIRLSLQPTIAACSTVRIVGGRSEIAHSGDKNGLVG